MTTGKGGAIYIITNSSNSVLYIGVTSELRDRIHQHRQKLFPNSFTSRYNCNKLVYFERFVTIDEAIRCEKQLKGGSRQKKLALVNLQNPEWLDLWNAIQDF